MGCDHLFGGGFRFFTLFQSTHPSGVRPDNGDGTWDIQLFQSTHPSGVRLEHVRGSHRVGSISIHAPQWGATLSQTVTASGSIFQSTHPSGVRPAPVRAGISSRVTFQSTHPSGVRPRTSAQCRKRPYFNPRTPVGCDLSRLCETRNASGFQSTHPSGVRLSSASKAHSGHDFNPRTPVGCDTSFYLYGTPEGFQSTHPSGVRPHADRREVMRGGFQSTHPSGVRHNRSDCRRDRGNISIHAPQWGATGAA